MICRSWSSRFCCLRLIFTLSILTANCFADDGISESDESPESLKFVKVYVPDDSFDQLPETSIKYAPPIDRQEFERLLGYDLQSRGSVRSQSSIKSALYTAKFENGCLVGKNAELVIEHEAESAAFVSLRGCGLPILRPRWKEDTSRPATLGLSANNDLVVLVDKKSNLIFDWSLRSKSENPEVFTFLLELPQCPANEMLLELPSNLTPTINRGLIERVSSSKSGNEANDTRGNDNDDSEYIWRIRLGGHHLVTLQLHSSDHTVKKQKNAILHQSDIYDVSLKGVELYSKLTLDVQQRQLSELKLRLDSDLHLISVNYGSNRQVQWKKSSLPGDAYDEIVLELPEPIQGEQRVLQLKAIAPVRVDDSWRLPVIKPQGVFWQEGISSVVVRSPLTLKKLDVTNGRQTVVSDLSSSLEGQMFAFQYYDREAAVEIELEHKQSHTEIDCGTTIRLQPAFANDNNILVNGRIKAFLYPVIGEQFVYSCSISPEWAIDSVERVADIRPNGEEAQTDTYSFTWKILIDDTANRTLQIRLSESIPPEGRLQILISGHRQDLDIRSAIRLSQFRIVDFSELRYRSNLLAINTESPFEMQMRDKSDFERIEQIDPATVADDLVDYSEGTFLSRIDAPGEDHQLEVVREQPRLTAEINVVATVTKDLLNQYYSIICSPDSSRISRLLIHFSHADENRINWSLPLESSETFSARRVFVDLQSEVNSGETWEIIFQTPYEKEFELIAKRSSERSEVMPISLVTFPSAQSQRGRLTVESSTPEEISIDSVYLKSIPSNPVINSSKAMTKASYRYDPASSGLYANISLKVNSNQSNAWVWSSRIESSFMLSGVSEHTATYFIQSAGRELLQLELPQSSTLRSISMNNVEYPSNIWEADENRIYQIPLVIDDRHIKLQVHYSARSAPLRIYSRIQLFKPILDIPVLDQNWTAWLPPGYVLKLNPAEGIDSRYPNNRRKINNGISKAIDRAFSFFPYPFVSSDQLGTDEEYLIQKNAAHILEILGGRHQSWQMIFEAIRNYEPESAQNRTLLIDHEALAEEGITPQTSPYPANEQDAFKRGISLLKASNLALIFTDKSILVSNLRNRAMYQTQLRETKNFNISFTKKGWLQAKLDERATDDDFIRPASWSAKAEQPKKPWLSSPPIAYKSLSKMGWSAWNSKVSADKQTEISVYRANTVRAIGLSLILLAALPAWRVFRYRFDLYILAFGLSGIAACLITPPYHTIVCGIFWGILTGGILNLILPRNLIKKEIIVDQLSSTSIGSPDASLAVKVLFIGFISLTLVFAAQAQESTEKTDEFRGNKEPYKILIPVDKNLKPSGEYYLPEKLYLELHRRSQSSDLLSPDWLLREATYQGKIDRSPSISVQKSVELLAIYEIEVFRPNVSVRIPFRRSEVKVTENGVSLDDQPIDFRWDPAGNAVLIDIRKPGFYRLQLSLQPAVKVIDSNSQFSMTIPELVNSKLELETIPNEQGIQVPSSLGKVDVVESEVKVLAQLGPSDRLVVLWPADDFRQKSDVSVDELLWLKASTGSVVLEAKFIFNSNNPIHQVFLKADPNLRMLLRGDSEEKVVETVTMNSENRQLIRLDLKEPFQKQTTLHVSFLISGVSKVGNIKVPFLEALAGRKSRRLLAFSVDDALSYQVNAGERSQSIAVTDFSGLWNENVPPPMRVYEIDSAESLLNLETRTRDSEITVTENISLYVDKSNVSFDYAAALKTNSGERFSYELALPVGCRIDDVSVVDAEMNRQDSHWSQDKSGTLTVFLNNPGTSDQEHLLNVKGALILHKESRVDLPLIRFVNTRSTNSKISVYRSSEVLLNISELKGLRPVEEEDPADDVIVDPNRRLAASFVSIEDNSSDVFATVLISPNSPDMEARLISALVYNSNTWMVELDYQLEVTDGSVDVLHFDMPSQWNDPIRLEPAEDFEIINIPGRSEKSLTIKPRFPITGKYRLRVIVPRYTPLQDQVNVPEIIPYGISLDKLEYFVVVPSQFDWKTQGMNSTKIPQDYSEDLVDASSSIAYRVTQKGARAELISSRLDSDVPQIWLADIHICWQSSGFYHGVATFDLEPAGLTRCSLELPPSLQLVQAKVSQLPAMLNSKGPNSWLMNLGSPQLTHRIEIVFTGEISEKSKKGARNFDAPVLSDFSREQEIDVERTLWTIYGPQWAGKGKLSQNIHSGSSLQHDLFRLKALNQVIELREDLKAENSQEEIDQWFLSWEHRRQVTRNHLRFLLSATQVANFPSDEIKKIDELYQTRKEDLNIQQVGNQVVASDNRESEYVDIFNSLVPSSRSSHAQFFMIHGVNNSVTVNYERSSPSSVMSFRILLAFLFAAAIGLLYIVRQNESLHRWATRWPQAIGVFLGLGWYLFLEPNVVGWLIVLGCLASLLRTRKHFTDHGKGNSQLLVYLDSQRPR